MVKANPRAEVRLQALSTLEGLNRMSSLKILQVALTDKHPGVRRQAVRIASNLLNRTPAVEPALLALAKEADPQVQLQLAYILGEWKDYRAPVVLAALAQKHQDDPFLLAAVLRSIKISNIAHVPNPFPAPT